jgi:hypothetical protein
MSATGGRAALQACSFNLRTSHKVAAWTVDLGGRGLLAVCVPDVFFERRFAWGNNFMLFMLFAVHVSQCLISACLV